MALTRQGDVRGDVCSGGEVSWGSEGDVQGDVRRALFAPMHGLAIHATQRVHNGMPGDRARDARSGESNQPRAGVLARPYHRALRSALLVMAAAALASCSSGPTHKASTTTTAPASTGSLPAGNGPIQAAVLSAWEDAEQTLYAYLQLPWQQQRADLVAGETSADLWPKLADYFVNPALQSESQFLVGVKMGELSGPATYNLGHPTVTALSSTTATITGCIYDTGTTTAGGKPGPATLDGGAGGAAGTWDLQLVLGSWKIATFKTNSVSKC